MTNKLKYIAPILEGILVLSGLGVTLRNNEDCFPKAQEVRRIENEEYKLNRILISEKISPAELFNNNSYLLNKYSSIYNKLEKNKLKRTKLLEDNQTKAQYESFEREREQFGFYGVGISLAGIALLGRRMYKHMKKDSGACFGL